LPGINRNPPRSTAKHFTDAFKGRGSGILTVQCLHESGGKYRIIVADDVFGLLKGATCRSQASGTDGHTLPENAKTDFNVETAPGKGLRPDAARHQSAALFA
jgi:hypothetical protein